QHITLDSHPLFFTARAPVEIFPLSLHDALPIWWPRLREPRRRRIPKIPRRRSRGKGAEQARESGTGSRRCSSGRYKTLALAPHRSEEHTSELQSRGHLVCRLLLEKNKHGKNIHH